MTQSLSVNKETSDSTSAPNTNTTTTITTAAAAAATTTTTTTTTTTEHLYSAKLTQIFKFHPCKFMADQEFSN